MMFNIFNKLKKKPCSPPKKSDLKSGLSTLDGFGYDFLAYGLMLSRNFQGKENAYQQLDLCANSATANANINDLKQAMITMSNSANSLTDINIMKAYLYALESLAYLRAYNYDQDTSYTPNELLSQFLPKADIPTMYKEVTFSEYDEEKKLYTEKFLKDEVWTLYDKLEALTRQMDEKYDPEVCISTVEKILQDLYQKYHFSESEQISFIRESTNAILYSFKPIETKDDK